MGQRKSYPEQVARGEVPPEPWIETRGPVLRGLVYLAEMLGGVAIFAAPLAYGFVTLFLPTLLGASDGWAIGIALVAWSPLPVLVAAWWLDQ